MNVYTDTTARSHAGAELARPSVKFALQFALRFVFRDAAEIWPRVALPMLAGGLTLYGALYLYLFEYERYLGRPSDRAASLVLGAATAGLLVTLFSHAVTTAAISSLALGRQDTGWKYFCASRRAWRIYAAYLQFVLVAAAAVAGIGILRIVLVKIGGGPALDIWTNAGLLAIFAVLVARVGYLIAPVATATDDGPVVRKAWSLSARHFWKLAATIFVFALPCLGVEAVCETVIRVAGFAQPMTQGGTMAEFVASYRASLPAVLVAVGTAYVLGVVLLVSASAATYHQITEHQEQ